MHKHHCSSLLQLLDHFRDSQNCRLEPPINTEATENASKAGVRALKTVIIQNTSPTAPKTL